MTLSELKVEDLRPNAILFRVDDDEQSHRFACLRFDNSLKLNESGETFSVLPGDSYEQLRYDQIALVHEELDNGSSYLMTTLTISSDNLDEEVRVCDLTGSDIKYLMVQMMIEWAREQQKE